MKKILILLVFAFTILFVKAQSWTAVPGYQISYGDVLGVTRYQGNIWVLAKTGIYKVTGSVWQLTNSDFTVNGSLGCMYSDGVDLYAGSVFYLGTTPLLIVKWDGVQWMPFAYSNNNGLGPVVTILKTSTGTIYAGGLFNNIGTQTVINNFPYFAMFNGVSWVQPFSVTTSGCSFGIENIQKIGDSIYVAGGFYEVNGLSSVATFRFKESTGMSNLDGYGFCSTARSFYLYQGMLYASGTRPSESSTIPLGLVKRIGNNWVSVSEQIQIVKTKITALLGKLYIAGRAEGFALNGFVPIVISYDGVNVVNEGLGVSSPPNPFSYIPEAAGIFADTVANKLYLYGNFLQSNGNVADNFAVKSFSGLPVKLTSFTAQLVAGNTALVRWHDETPSDLNSFEVQMSTDGRTFSTIGAVAGKSSLKEYSFPYQLSGCGARYVRLKYDGGIYSNTAAIAIPCDIDIQGQKQSVRIQTKYPGLFTLTAPSGQVLVQKSVPGGYSQLPVTTPVGLYIAKFTDSQGTVFVQKIFLQ